MQTIKLEEKHSCTNNNSLLSGTGLTFLWGSHCNCQTPQFAIFIYLVTNYNSFNKRLSAVLNQ